MYDMTIEEEFSLRKIAHMYAILKFKMMEYYEALEMGKLNLPNFVRNDSPEKKAEKEIDYLLKNDKEKFIEMYELAYKDLAERGILN